MSPVLRRCTGWFVIVLMLADATSCYHYVGRVPLEALPQDGSQQPRATIGGVTKQDGTYVDYAGRTLWASADTLYGAGKRDTLRVAIGDMRTVWVKQIQPGRTALLVVGITASVLAVTALAVIIACDRTSCLRLNGGPSFY